MKIQNAKQSYILPMPLQKPISFEGYRGKFVKDIFVRQKSPVQPLKKGLERITGIQKGNLGGTTCNGAITMKNFWSLFKASSVEDIKAKGFSTNKRGTPHCFLKAKSDEPISTSYVHDCSVMYLYNESTRTHCLYHAAYDCKPSTIDFMIENLMPEGFTHGSITPGDSYWNERHVHNLKNMFKAMKRHNPDAVVNVFSEVSKYPEIVGYKGKTYEVLNADYQQQLKNNSGYLQDRGQASFRILDLQGYNTFDRLTYKCLTLKDVEKFRKYFKKQQYNSEMLAVLNKVLDIRADNIKMIESCKNFDEIKELQENFTLSGKDNYSFVFRINKEKILMEELEKVHTAEEYLVFYYKVKSISDHSLMDTLHSVMVNKIFY